MKRKFQILFIAAVIVLILIGEAVVYVPQRSTASTVVIKSYPTTDALVQALSNGEVDLAPMENVAAQTLLQLKNDANLNIIPIDNFGFTYIGMNLRKSPLNNPVFRQAMLYGFNRERVLSDSLAGYGEIIGPGLFSSAYGALGWTNESINSYPYDPSKASALLDSIGFTQTSSGVRMDPSTGQQLHTMFIFSKLTDPQAVAAANMFAADMQAIGLPIISFPETNIDFYSQVSVTYYFDMYIETEAANAAPTWLYNLFAGINNIYPAPLSTNLVGYNNSTFNECARQLMTASSTESAKLAALTCQEELSLDLPALPVYSKNLLIAEQKSSFNITPIAGSISDTIAASLANVTAGSLVTIGEVGGLSDINPAITSSAADSLALRLITSPLLTHGPDGSIRPGVVDHWQMSDNATNLTLNLSQTSSFQDGSTATAYDLAATLNWLVTNTLPSSPIFPILKTMRAITEVDPYTVRIRLGQSNYFAAYQIGNLFVVPASALPQGNGPLALLLSGALQSSGPFELVRFVQGAEVDLQSVGRLGSANLPSISGVQGQIVFGYLVGGSQVQITSQQLAYEGQPVENATYTVDVYGGNSTTEIAGTYAGFGVYWATLNLNGESIPLGNHVVVSELYGQLPAGAIIQFERQNLIVHPPLFLGQVIVYLLAVAALAFAAHGASHGKRRKIVRRRARRIRRKTATRPRRRR